MSRSAVIALAFLLGCHAAPSEPSAATSPEAAVEDDVTVEVLAEGSGTRATDQHRVWVHYEFVDAQTSARVRGSETHPAIVLLAEAPLNPFDIMLHRVLRGAAPGYHARVLIPIEAFDATKPERAPSFGDMWLTVSVERVDVPRPRGPQLGIEAFSGEPVASWTLDDGAQLHEYVTGEGPQAAVGDFVEFYIEMTHDELTIGQPEEQLNHTWITEADTWLKDAKPGALREVTKDSTHLYIQVLDVVPDAQP